MKLIKVKLKCERQVCGKPPQKKGEIIELAEEEGLRLISVKQAEEAPEKAKEK